MHIRLGKVSHVVPAETRALRKELAQANGLVEKRARDRKGPPRFRIETAVRQHQTRADRACVGTREQEVGEPPDTLGVEDDLRAEEQDKSALAALEPEVGGAAVAQVLRLDEHRRLGLLIRD